MGLNLMIRKSMEELSGIMHIGLGIYEVKGSSILPVTEIQEVCREFLTGFWQGEEAVAEQDGRYFGRVKEEGLQGYIIVAGSLAASCPEGDFTEKVCSEEDFAKEDFAKEDFLKDGKKEAADREMAVRIAVGQVKGLLHAVQEKTDRNQFFQRLLQGGYLGREVYQKAQKLHIKDQVWRIVFRIETGAAGMETATELLKGMYTTQMGDYVTAVEQGQVVLIKSVGAGEDGAGAGADRIAETIVDMMNTEALLNVRVGYGSAVQDLGEVERSYQEAGMALEAGRIFFADRKVNAYNALGVGRLIYELPDHLCQIFLQEVLGNRSMPEFDEETLTTVNRFLENNLNMSETARKLFIHRNTLVYRIEKLEKATGLDIRRFEDALLFKMALMVSDYIRYKK